MRCSLFVAFYSFKETMRYFLYSYENRQNFNVTREHRVFGAPKGGGDHPDTNVRELREGDIIIIRDASMQSLHFLGYCVVSGQVRDQEDPNSPWPDLLWKDELAQSRVIYHLRCAVDFENAPQLSLSRLTWDDLDSLDFPSGNGKPIRGTQAWGQKLSGNFIQDESEVASFSRLVGLETE